MKRPAFIWLAASLAPGLAGAQAPSVGGLETAIVGGTSASAVLQAWCLGRGLPKLTASRLVGVEKPAGASVRAALGVRPGQRLAYRRVRLGCGAQGLSVADNWYLPDRLTPEMNRKLNKTDEPFGLVVRPLNFSRRTVGVTRSPGANHFLEIRAVLVSATGAPFSYVIEDYSRDLAPMRGQ